MCLVIKLCAATSEQEYQLTSSDGFSVDKSIVQSDNTIVSNTNGRTVFKGIGVTLNFFW
jgi:hypothetical protein